MIWVVRNGLVDDSSWVLTPSQSRRVNDPRVVGSVVAV